MALSPDALQPSIMGIVNVTPDSFFAAARTHAHSAAVERGRALFAAGCDVVDVGGESTRPGAHEVGPDEELSRVLDVVEALAHYGAVSIDTRKAAVARASVRAGAVMVNDVSGTLVEVAAELGVGYVAMHSQGTPATMQIAPHYDDVVAEVLTALEQMAQRARSAGVTQLWLDPGIGFGKSFDHNLALIAHCARIVDVARHYGAGVLLGTSRKGFVGQLTRDRLDVNDRLEGTLATEAWAMLEGVTMLRVHDVTPALQLRDLVNRPLAEVGA